MQKDHNQQEKNNTRQKKNHCEEMKLRFCFYTIPISLTLNNVHDQFSFM